MKYLHVLISAVLAVTIFSISPLLHASEHEGAFNIHLICEEELEISGEAAFALEQLENGESLQLLMHHQLDETDFFTVSLIHSNGALSPGTYAVGDGAAVTGSVTRAIGGRKLRGEVASGELNIEQATEELLVGSVEFLVHLNDPLDDVPRPPCSAGGGFTALPPGPGGLPPIPPPADPLPGPGDDTGAPDQTCADGPKPGTWSMTVGKMLFDGVFTPLGGGAQDGVINSVDGGEKITADFAGVGRLEFEPFTGNWPPLKGRLYKATKLPSAFGDGIYWYLSCDSSTAMMSTSGIKKSHRGTAPPHIQFHRWEAN